ncbi:EAL domain-containing protein [Escherichia coli]
MYNIKQPQGIGFRIAIDDFGTGYANYERLKRLQADIIKIDGVFRERYCHEHAGCDVVRLITDSLAKASY